jgi:hypothetical protein
MLLWRFSLEIEIYIKETEIILVRYSDHYIFLKMVLIKEWGTCISIQEMEAEKATCNGETGYEFNINNLK